MIPLYPNNAMMDRKQKERLRFLLKARKRADKVLSARREAQRKKQEHAQRTQANQDLLRRYTSELNLLAEQCGILILAEQAASLCGAELAQNVSYYMDYGLSDSNFQRAFVEEKSGELKVSHLAIRVIWQEAGDLLEAEIRVHKNGQVTFHNSFIPVFPFIWRRYPHVLQKMLTSAMQHPRPCSAPCKPPP